MSIFLAPDIDSINSSLTGLETEINGSFKDGIIDEIEKASINEKISILEKDKVTLDKQYNVVYTNTDLTGDAKTNLLASKTSYDSSYTSLKTDLNNILNDSIISNITAKVNAYNTAIADLSEKLNRALDSISATKANTSLASAKTYAEAQASDVANTLTSFKNTVNTTFKDGIIDKAETLALEKQIKLLNIEKTDIDNMYNAIYSNSDLIDVAKTDLYNAKENYNTAHNNLINSINNAISDNKITSEEQTVVNDAFVSYSIALSNYSVKHTEALNSVAEKKKQDSISYTNTKVSEVAITPETIVTTVKNHQTNGQNTFMLTSSFTQTANEFDRKIEEYKNSTTVNYILNSNFEDGMNNWHIWNGYNADAGIWGGEKPHWLPEEEGIGIFCKNNDKYIELQSNLTSAVQGETWTFSMYVGMEGNVKGCGFAVKEKDKFGKDLEHYGVHDIPIGNGRQHVSFTIRNSKTKYIQLIIVHSGSNSSEGGFVIWLNRAQLEKGYLSSWRKAVTDGVEKKYLEVKESINGISTEISNIKGDYTSKSTFEQTVNEFNFKFENTGGENIVANSDFSGGNTFWTCVNGAILTPHANWIDNSYGRMARVTCDKHNSGITQYLKTIPGQTYTVSFYAEAEGGRPLSTQIGILDSITIDLGITPSFARHSFTFTAWNTVHPFIAYTNNNTGTFYIGRIMVTQGTVLQEYRQNSTEIYSDDVKIDKSGLTVYSTDGSYTTMSSRGLEHWKDGMARPYKFINILYERPKQRNGSFFSIVLPIEFQGKSLNDFTIVPFFGALDLDPYSVYQEDSLRQAYIHRTGWDAWSRTLTFQVRMQKIGLDTRKLFGWDASTTSEGAIIGEGAMDCNILVQM